MLHYLKIFIFASFVILVILVKSLPANNRKTLKFQNYEFVYKEADSTFAKALISRVTGSLKSIEDFLGYKNGSIVTIIMTRSESEYLSYTMNRVPEWSQAVAIPENKIIILKIAKPEDVGRSPEIVLHEIVHILLGERFSAHQIPVWLNEGIAQLLSGYKISFNDKILLANAITANNLPELNSLDSLLDFSPVKARVAYLEALFAVEYILRKHGEEKLKNLIRQMGRTSSQNNAFKLTFGYDFIDFEISWYQDLEEEYKWLVFLNFDNLLWISICFLAILSIIVIRIRNRRKLRDWEQFEELNY